MTPDLGQAEGPLVLTEVLGNAAEPLWRERLHVAEAAGRLEVVRVAQADAMRRRMRLRTDRGRDVAVALSRDAALSDGAVLHWDETLTIVSRVDVGPRLRLTPADATSALRLGFFCGNLHWKADFRAGALEIVMDGPEDGYRARLRDAANLCVFDVERLEPDA